MSCSFLFNGNVSNLTRDLILSGAWFNASNDELRSLFACAIPLYSDCRSIIQKPLTERCKAINGLHRDIPLQVIVEELLSLKLLTEFCTLLTKNRALNEEIVETGGQFLDTDPHTTDGKSKKNTLVISASQIASPEAFSLYLRIIDCENGGFKSYRDSGLKALLHEFRRNHSKGERLAKCFIAFYKLDSRLSRLGERVSSMCWMIQKMGHWETLKAPPSGCVPLQLTTAKGKPKPSLQLATIQNLVPGILQAYTNFISWFPLVRNFQDPEIEKPLSISLADLSALVKLKYFERQVTLINLIAKGGLEWNISIPVVLSIEGPSTVDFTHANFREHYQELTKLINELPTMTTSPGTASSSTNIDELAAFVSGRSTGKRKKGKGKRTVVKTPQLQQKSVPPSGASSSYPVVEPLPPTDEKSTPVVNPFSPLLDEVLIPKKLLLDVRVLDWMRSSPETAEDSRQLCYHGFSPFVDRLIANKELRNRFALKTSTGWGLIADFTYADGSLERGVITYGISKSSKRCYHRYFERVTNDRILSNKLKDLVEECAPKEIIEALPTIEATDEETLNLFNDGFIGDEINVEANTGAFTVMDRKNHVFIRVYPIR